MRHLTYFGIAAIARFGSSACLRCYPWRTLNSQRRLSIAGAASISILLSGVWCAGAATGEDFIESGSPVPEVPMVDANTSSENPGEIDLSTPQGFEDGCPMNYEMPHMEHPDQYSSDDSFPSDDSGYADEYSPMATSEILMPMTSAPVMLLPKTFVHEPKLVRMSDRSAEIWVTLPERAYVSVNSVEYPPEGTFRIFRTKLTTQEPRRFYISARQGRGKGQITLSPTTILAIDEASGRHFVDLFPGQRAEIDFPTVDPQPIQSAIAITDDKQQTLLEGKLDAILMKLGPGDSTIDNLIQAQTDQIKQSHEESAKFHRKATRSLRPIASIQQALAPSDASSSVTRRFHFDEAGLRVTGKASVQDGRVTAIDWTNHPVSVSLVAPKSIEALPARPFEATVTFSLREGVAEPFSTFEPMTIQFHDAGDNVFAQIAFLEQFAGALTDALVKAHAGPGTYRIGATIRYELQLGELGNIVVSGEIQNTIDLVVQP